MQYITRDDQSVNDSFHHMLREAMPQVAETGREAGTVTNHVADVHVPAQVTVEQHAQALKAVFDILKLG